MVVAERQKGERPQDEFKLGLQVKTLKWNSMQLTTKMNTLFDELLKLSEKEDTQLNRQQQLASDIQEDCVSADERDSAVTTIKLMQRFYGYNSETLADAVSYMDRFLSKVKVKQRYMSCVAAAAFYLSTKMHEESEYHPTASDLARLHRLTWKPSDLKRMEKILLEKLEWTLFPSVTTLKYIHIIFQVLASVSRDLDNEFLRTLVKRSEVFINYTSCAQFRACTLAVSIVHQCLKESGLDSVVTMYLLLNIQAVCKIHDSELFSCQCAISKQLHLHNNHPETHPPCIPLPKLVPRPNLIKRLSLYGNTNLPAIEEVSLLIESREENKMAGDREFQCSDLDMYYPKCYISSTTSQTFPLKSGPTYCQLQDRCFTQDQGAFLGLKMCNITVL